MRHLSTVGFSAIEAESFKALKLEPRSKSRVLTLPFLFAKNPVPTTNSGEFVGEIASGDFLNHFPHNSAASETLILVDYLIDDDRMLRIEHYAAWGEDLVLALRPGEIIPSERLRDTETGIGSGGRYLWLRAQRLRCRPARAYPDIRGISGSGHVRCVRHAYPYQQFSLSDASEDCTCLAELPTNLRRLINLRHLDFRGLQNIKHAEDALEAKLRDKKLSEIHLKWEGDTANSQNDRRVLGNLQPNTNLKVLAIKGYGALGRLTSLKRLEIDGLNGVELVGSEFYGPAFKSLEFLSFHSMQEWQEWCFPGGEEEEGGHFPNLCELSLENCPKLTGKLPLYYFPRLERLTLQEVNIEFLACSQEYNKFNIELPSLRDLGISDCPNLVCFVGGGVLLAPNLKRISMCCFKNLWSVPEEMHASLPSLQSLSIQGSKEFKSFPEESKFPSLSYLIIQDCPELESFPEGGLPSKLRYLGIRSCKKLMANRIRWGLQTLTSLKYLDLDFSKCEEEEIGESFPEEGLLPTTLTSLRISNHPNLKTIDGKALRHLISLETLKISFCPQLQSLPDEGLPTSLSRLEIRECDLLTQRCQRDTGEDWAKISHIPKVLLSHINLKVFAIERYGAAKIPNRLGDDLFVLSSCYSSTCGL
ncbi:unnamed protein product [Malus baccata var. baccata]